LQPGLRGNGAIHFGDDRFEVAVVIDTTDPSAPFIELIHKTRDDRAGDRIVRDHVALIWTVPNYSGRRWWFVCPRTGRKVVKLFLPNGGWHFWSREAYGLGYACQREDRFSRFQRRAAKLNRQLGGEGWSTWAEPAGKPKWMRWRTYERKLSRWERAVERANGAFVERAERFLRRLPHRSR
jgi:hypothetical protein